MHLIDAFMPVIAYVAGFRASEELRPEYPQARGEILRLLEEAEKTAAAAGLQADDYDLGRFAVCAFVDEALLSSGWDGRALWQHEQLQRLHYRTTDAGVEFFERLTGLRDEQRDVREVYCLCLLLGFRGRYVGKDDGLRLEQLKASNLEILCPGAAGAFARDGAELFPGAISDSSPGQPLRREGGFAIAPMNLVLAAAPVILFALLYLVYRYVLNGLVLPVP